jgi:hypothetical protein
MGKIDIIRELVRNGLYYFTDHALAELEKDGLDEYDAETILLNGKIRKSWPTELKFEIIGSTHDGRALGVVCRITKTYKLRIITAYEDQ